MKKTYFLIATLCMLGLSFSHAQVTSGFGIGGGISKAMGDGSEYINLGFNGGLEYFHQASDAIFIGGRFAYNYFGIDEEELLGDLGVYGVDLDMSMSIIELCPSVRFVAPGTGAQFFLQGGGGLYLMNVKAKAGGDSESESENEFGFNLGGGLIFGQSTTKVAIYPMYNHIATEGEATKYFSVNLTLIFNK